MNALSKYALSTLLGVSISYNANALTFDLNTQYSGGAQPSGFLRVAITDTGTPSTVQITLTSFLQGTEFASDVYLNLDPTLNPSLLTGLVTPTSTTGTFVNPTVNLGANAFSADGGGRYDINFAFQTGPPSARFDNGDSVTYLVGGITGLDALDFSFLSQPPNGGNGFHIAAAHIQAITPNSSGSTSSFVSTVPDGGATAMLLGIAFVSLGAFRRRLA
jgi:VPDSG-CTERM exosortase interaction domain